jgi:hypothetical protein
MKGYLSKLRPFERRLVVGIGVVFFIVFNLVFVRPYFYDWSTMQIRLREAQEELDKYEKEFQQTNNYARTIRTLEQEGSTVPPEDQALRFSSAIFGQAGQSGVEILQNSRITTRTNQFFMEQTQTINVQAGEPQLIDFLYNLGSGASLIRVRDLSIRPDPPRYHLVANVKLVASYQKKLPVKGGAAGRGSADSSSAKR